MDNIQTNYPISTWINQFVRSNYFVQGYVCQCGDLMPCDKYFCIQCKVGHLCKKLHFRSNCQHDGHLHLQVRKVTFRSAILTQDAEKYQFDTNGIQVFDFTKDSFYFLRSKALQDLHGNVPKIVHKNSIKQCCILCKASIQTGNGKPDALYCSLECKLSILADEVKNVASILVMMKYSKIDTIENDEQFTTVHQM